MKPLLKKYLALGIAVQFIVAGLADLGGLLFTDLFRQMGVILPTITVVAMSLRHWAFVWPLAVLLLTVVLTRKARTETILMHLFGSMMLAAVALTIILIVSFLLPFCAVSSPGE
jgi:hypothetical protein